MRPLLALSVLLGGCTLLAHDATSLPRCAQSTDCEALNRRFDIASTDCLRYGCDLAGGAVCVLGPRDDDGDGDPALECGGTDCDDADPARRGGGGDACDGIDNDCDRVIDEDAFAPDPRVVASSLPPGSSLAGAMDAEGALAVTVSSEAGAFVEVVHPEGAPSERTPIALRTQRETPGGIPSPFTSYTLSEEGQCYPSPATCRARAAIAAELEPDAGRWLLAAVSDTSGCAQGQLRVAWMTRASGEAITMGPPARAAPALGVDVASLGACTGTLSGAALGASEPALAVLAAPSGRQALLAYLARPIGAGPCGGTDAEVQAIGLGLTSGSIGSRPAAWVDATGANAPVTLGVTRGGGRPALAAIDEPPGYLAAFASAGGITLAFVPAFPPIDGADVDTSCEATDSCDAPHATAPISATLLGTYAVGAGATEVSLAPGVVRGGLREVGLAWETGCGAAGSGSFFALVRVDPLREGSVEGSGAHALGGDRAAAPALAYLASGFVTADFERGSRAAGTDHAGGWVAVFREEARLYARRFTELDGAALDPEPLALVAGASSRAELGATGGLARYAVASTDGSLVGGTIGCARR